jgi:hypothetical protein
LDDKVALDATILEWIGKYQEEEPAAMTEMVNFILRVKPFKGACLIPVLRMQL